MKLVVLTGIPGSGSTTLLNRALEKVEYVYEGKSNRFQLYKL